MKISRKFNLAKDLGESYRYETVDIEVEGSDVNTLTKEQLAYILHSWLFEIESLSIKIPETEREYLTDYLCAIKIWLDVTARLFNFSYRKDKPIKITYL